MTAGESSHREEASAFPFNEEDYGDGDAAGPIDDDDDDVEERCRRVLDYYEDECRKPAYETARWLVEQLSPKEQETAARCSYSYWYLSTQQRQRQGGQRKRRPSESDRFATALREAVHHMDCADDVEEILRLFRATIDFHSGHQTCLYRTCVARDAAATDLGRERRDRIHDEMTRFQTNVVRGHDKEGRAVFFALPRKKAGTPEGEQAFVDSLVYTIERTLACSEFRSVGRQDQLIVVLDTKSGTCPPIKTLQAAIGILQKHYPGRLKGCVILNAPYVLRTGWKMLRPFVHPVTYQKYIFGPSQNNPGINAAMIRELFDESQAAPVLMPGRGRLTAAVDAERFLYEVPFHRLYDEEHSAGSSIKEEEGKPRTDGHRLRKQQQIISPSTESSSTFSLSSMDSSSSSVGLYFDAESSPSEQHSAGKKKKKRRSLKERFGFTQKRRYVKVKPGSEPAPPPPPKSTMRNVSVTVRTLAIGKLSVMSSDEVNGDAHRNHW